MVKADGDRHRARIGLVYGYLGLERHEVPEASAGDIILSVNSGTDSTVWYISGEPSLVMNGFDLTPLNVQLPAKLDRISLEVNTPVPGASIDVVVYEDSNGGSPIDARLVSVNQVDIREAGTFIVQFAEPIVINSPVIWVLPSPKWSPMPAPG